MSSVGLTGESCKVVDSIGKIWSRTNWKVHQTPHKGLVLLLFKSLILRSLSVGFKRWLPKSTGVPTGLESLILWVSWHRRVVPSRWCVCPGPGLLKFQGNRLAYLDPWCRVHFQASASLLGVWLNSFFPASTRSLRYKRCLLPSWTCRCTDLSATARSSSSPGGYVELCSNSGVTAWVHRYSWRVSIPDVPPQIWCIPLVASWTLPPPIPHWERLLSYRHDVALDCVGLSGPPVFWTIPFSPLGWTSHRSLLPVIGCILGLPIWPCISQLHLHQSSPCGRTHFEPTAFLPGGRVVSFQTLLVFSNSISLSIAWFHWSLSGELLASW